MSCYILNEDGEPIEETSTDKWAEWMCKTDRSVAKDEVGESTVSTVFLGIDYAYGLGSPTVWETMIFGGGLDGEYERCSGSRVRAEEMHMRMKEEVLRNILAIHDIIKPKNNYETY